MADSTRTRILGATAMAAVIAGPGIALAQEDDAEFLGTIELGESKREVQTGTAVPVTVIDQEEMEDRQASTIAELIDSVPGVSLLNGSTPGGSGIVIRGFGANGTYGSDQKVAIQIDGASAGSEEIYRVGTQLYTDPYLYKSVEVIRGTVGSFEYGSGVIGGVVRLETKDASDFTDGEVGFNLAQTFDYASNGEGFGSSTLLAWQPSESLELLGNYTYRELGLQDDGNGDEIGNSEFELPSYLLKGRYSFGANNDQAFEMAYNYSETADRDVPYDQFGVSGGVFGNVDRDTVNETFTIGYEYGAAGNDLLDLNILFSYANQEIDQTCLPASAPYGCFDVVDADLQYETTKLKISNAAFLTFAGADHDVRMGVEFINKERLDANSAPGGSDDRIALYLVSDTDFGNGFVFTPAIRYETSDIESAFDVFNTSNEPVSYSNDALMGGASLRYDFDTGLSVFGSYAYTENLPILDDLLTPLYMEQSEKSTTGELGFSYDTIGLMEEGDSFAFKANYFALNLWDVTSYSDAASVRTQGFELEASYANESGLYADLSATLTTAEETNTSAGVVLIDWDNQPADNLRLSLGRKFGEALDLSLEAIAVDEIDVNGAETEGYVLGNLRGTYRPQKGLLEGTEFRFGVENLGNEQYTPVLATRVQPGRNFKLSVSRVF